jgi:hypothetical protein
VVDEVGHQRLDQRWKNRFAANHVLKQKWQILYDAHRAKLLGSRTSPTSG